MCRRGGSTMRVPALPLLIWAIGCTDPTEPPETVARVVSNAVTLPQVDANKVALTALAGGKLDLSSQAASTLLDSPGDREVLGYAISCALAKGESVSGRAGGVTYQFAGRVGLARKWRHTRLSEKDRRWVSACVLA